MRGGGRFRQGLAVQGFYHGECLLHNLEFDVTVYVLVHVQKGGVVSPSNTLQHAATRCDTWSMFKEGPVLVSKSQGEREGERKRESKRWREVRERERERER